MYISEFWFLKLCHREFCQTCWEIFKKCEIMKICHTAGHFTTTAERIWQKNYESSLKAWTNEEKNVIILTQQNEICKKLNLCLKPSDEVDFQLIMRTNFYIEEKYTNKRLKPCYITKSLFQIPKIAQTDHNWLWHNSK